MNNDERLSDLLRMKYKDLDTANFVWYDFLHLVGSGVDALLYAKLFWPDFVEVHHAIVLKMMVDDEDSLRRLQLLVEQHAGDIEVAESFFNFVEIPYLFGKHGGETDDGDDLLLAEVISEMWKARLQSLFPSRTFVVRVVEADQSAEVGIVFSQIKYR